MSKEKSTFTLKIEEMETRWKEYLQHYPDVQYIGFVPELIEAFKAHQSIVSSFRSCLAGDGDERTWEKCALDMETISIESIENVLKTY